MIIKFLSLISVIVIIGIFVVDEDRTNIETMNNNETYETNYAVKKPTYEDRNIYQEMLQIMKDNEKKYTIFSKNTHRNKNNDADDKYDKINKKYSYSLPIPIPQNSEIIKYSVSFPPPIPDNKVNNSFTCYH